MKNKFACASLGFLPQSTPTSSNPISPQLSVTWAFQRDSRSYAGGKGGAGAGTTEETAAAGEHVETAAATHRQSSVEEEEDQQQQQQEERKKSASSSAKIREVFGRRIRLKL